jgi:3-(3-hydroxy-phenyl)propionate hydroxylase
VRDGGERAPASAPQRREGAIVPSQYKYPKYPYKKPAEIGSAQVRRVPVAIAGAGPVGMCAAIDLAQLGVPVVILDDEDTVSVGSRAVCYAKRAIEVLDRLGCGEPLAAKGVSWNIGRTFLRDEEVYRFDLQPDADHHRPGMVNLQQYYLEEYLVQRIGELPAIDLRWKNRVVSVGESADGATLQIETPDGIYSLQADWLIVADGARSPIRKMLGLDVEGKVFMDRFLIADVIMKADFPAERWFWFDPPFHRGQSVLLHKQADNVWRIDFQLGWNADPDEEKKPERVIPRIRAMLGEDREFELEWVSVYTFQCRRMSDFRRGRLMFVGDAAHQVSPFGARGANSGIQDTDNLAWKLKLVMDGKAPDALLDTYGAEREFAADENIRNSTRSTDFITPKSRASVAFRDATLALANEHAFARALVNSGRLSVPSFYVDSPLNTPDAEPFAGRMVPGAPLDDAPIEVDGRGGWLLQSTGNRFQALVFAGDPGSLPADTVAAFKSLAGGPVPVEVLLVADRPATVPGLRVLVDRKGVASKRLDGRDGTTYLLRPDQHVCARMRAFDAGRLRDAVRRATCTA